MNVRVQFYSRPVYRFLIPKEKYYPEPGVDGALVTFRLFPPSARAPVGSEKGFLALVGKAFLSRRKMMRNSVSPLYETAQVRVWKQSVGCWEGSAQQHKPTVQSRHICHLTHLPSHTYVAQAQGCVGKLPD